MSDTAQRLGAEHVAALTPPDRNRYADLLRVGSIGVVVFGHWLLAVVTIRDGALQAGNLLAIAPATQWLTWVFQVMPLFFFVGGYANAAAWSKAATRGETWNGWVRARARRLLRPVLPLLAVWVPLAALLALVGVPGDLLRTGTQVVIVPTWFLATYLVIVAAAPATHALHRRYGAGALAAMVGLAVLVDVAHLAGVPLVGWTNFFFVWGTLHQSGYFWHDRRLPTAQRAGWALGAVGFAALIALTTVADYPVSMVGVDGAGRTNNLPPSVALLALGLAQIGLVIAFRHRAERLLRRPRVWFAVVTAGSVAMTLYLWHMTALVAVAGALYPTRLWPGVRGTGPGFAGSGGVDLGWWLLRPLWFAACAAALMPLIALFSRFERPRARAQGSASDLAVPAPSALGAAFGLAAAVGGLGLLAAGGLYQTGGGVPLPQLGMFTAGLGALGVLRVR